MNQQTSENKHKNQEKKTSSRDENEVITEGVHRRAEKIAEALFKGK